jgi:chromosome partitioning protein
VRTILILNPKGGCGKSTIATNIAGYFAMLGKNVSLADCDPQCSSSDWLRVRPEHLATINHVPVEKGKLLVPGDTEILILDTSASIHGQKMAKIVRAAQTMIIPVLPSPMDIRAAEKFISDLIQLRKKSMNKNIKIATIANRVNEMTIAADKIDDYLYKIKLPNGKRIPYIALLRASQNYIYAAEQGKTIFELAPSRTSRDREKWKPLLRWLNSKRSLP